MPAKPLDRRSFLLGAALLLAAPGARADEGDHELARRLLREGRIRPLPDILAAVQREVPGEVLKVEFEIEDGAYVYELKILAPDGRIREIEADAATGTILKVEDDD